MSSRSPITSRRAGAKIHEAHGDRRDLIGEGFADDIRGHEPVPGLEPRRSHRAERRLGARRGDRQRRVLGTREQKRAAEAVDRLLQAVTGRGLNDDLLRGNTQHGCRVRARLVDVLVDEVNARAAARSEELGIRVHFAANNWRERSECRPVEVAGLGIEGLDIRRDITRHCHIFARRTKAWAGAAVPQPPKRRSRLA